MGGERISSGLRDMELRGPPENVEILQEGNEGSIEGVTLSFNFIRKLRAQSTSSSTPVQSVAAVPVTATATQP